MCFLEASARPGHRWYNRSGYSSRRRRPGPLGRRSCCGSCFHTWGGAQRNSLWLGQWVRAWRGRRPEDAGIGDVESGTILSLGGGPCELRSQETLTLGKRLLLRATHARARIRSQVRTASQVEGGICASCSPVLFLNSPWRLASCQAHTKFLRNVYGKAAGVTLGQLLPSRARPPGLLRILQFSFCKQEPEVTDRRQARSHG